MAFLPLIVGLAGTALSAYGANEQGKAAQDQADYQAKQLEINAGQAQASGQIAAANQNRDTALTVSRARAVAAASGGGVSDPTVVKIMSDIAGEGQYRSDVQRYQGDTQARSDRNQASALRYGGSQAANAGRINAVSTVISGGASTYNMYNKYYGSQTNNPNVIQ